MSATFTEGQNELNDPEVDREPKFRPIRWGQMHADAANAI